jgi:uncharacterized phiE125 gp8 family phage protein
MMVLLIYWLNVVGLLNMLSMNQQLFPEIVTRPTVEPVTLFEAKKQLEMSLTDDAHDDHLTDLIKQCREQFEDDTDTALLTQTWKVQCQSFGDKITLPKRPVQSITTVKYYDGANVQQTLSSALYQLHKPLRQIRLAYQATTPATAARWDAWEITYVCGYGSDATNVPGVAKRAILQLIGYYFDANRGDNDRSTDLGNYEKLVLRYMRASYP